MRWNIERNIVQQLCAPLTILLQMQRIDTNTVTLTRLHKLIARIGELVRADTDLISRLKYLAPHALRVNIDMIGATQIDDTMGTQRQLLQIRMISRNLWIIQHHHIIWETSDGNNRSIQLDGPNFRYTIQRFRCLLVTRSSTGRRKLLGHRLLRYLRDKWYLPYSIWRRYTIVWQWGRSRNRICRLPLL